MICKYCQKELPETNFNWRNKDKKQRSSKCKKCHSEYLKQHYKDNKTKYKERSKKSSKKIKQRNRDFIRNIKAELGCKYCQEKDPCCLDFHHHDDNKEHNISQMLGHSLASIEKEAMKCEVVCANCHRKIHHYGL